MHDRTYVMNIEGPQIIYTELVLLYRISITTSKYNRKYNERNICSRSSAEFVNHFFARISPLKTDRLEYQTLLLFNCCLFMTVIKTNIINNKLIK